MPTKNRSDAVHELGVSTAKGSIIFVAAQIISSLITLVLLVGMTRLLRPADYGFYSIAVAFAAFLGMGGRFGMGTALRKMLPESTGRKRIIELISNSYFLAGVIAIAIAALGIIFAGPIAVAIYKTPSITLPLQIAAVVVFLTAIMEMVFAALVGLGMIKEAAIADIVYSIVQAVASVALVLAGHGVTGAMVGYALGFVFGIAMGSFYLIRRIGLKATSPSTKTLGELAKFTVPIVVSNVSALGATNFAVLILGVYASAQVVGNYGAAYRLGSLFIVILTSVTFILLASFSKAFSKKNLSKSIERIYNASLEYSLVFVLPLLAFLVAVAVPVSRLLFSSAYALAPLYFDVVAFGTVLGIVGSFAGTLIISYGDTRRFMYYQMAVIAVEFILLLALTPLFLARGTLLAVFIIAPLLSNAIYIMALERQFSISINWGKLLRIVLPSLLLWVLAAIISMALHQHLATILMDAALFLLLYPPLMALAKAVDKKDILFLRHVADRLRGVGAPIEYLLRYTELFIK